MPLYTLKRGHRVTNKKITKFIVGIKQSFISHKGFVAHSGHSDRLGNRVLATASDVCFQGGTKGTGFYTEQGG